jgi:hypothetical protein
MARAATKRDWDMRLRCTNEKMINHSFTGGTIFEEGKEYDVIGIIQRKVEFITDYDRYWEKTKLIAGAREWIRKGYTKENLHEVIPGYLTIEEVKRLYVKEVMVPHAIIKGDDVHTVAFCLTSYEEFYKMGAAISEARNNHLRGKPAFEHTVRVIDEYFDYVQIRRDKKLLEIGI